MPLWDKVKGELIDIIEWLDSSSEIIVKRFERYGNEIKYGAKLIVREGQCAVFVNEGTIVDTFNPGTYTLDTKNLPILSTLLGWKYGFESPFKAEVYFCNTRQFLDLKWGTKNPIMIRDAEFGPVRLRAFGNYAFKVQDAARFLKEIVGTDGHYTKDEITDQLRNLIVTRFTDILGESKIPILDLAANYDELSHFVEEKIKPEFSEYGVLVTKMLVGNISLPPAVEEALDKRSSMGVIGNLQAYTQYQAASSMEDAANNPSGGGAAEGMGLGMGFAMANQMGQVFSKDSSVQSGQSVPPPIPAEASYFIALNGQSHGPFDMNILTQKISSGELTKESMLWKQGMAGWAKAAELAEINELFASSSPNQMPPPPPPGV